MAKRGQRKKKKKRRRKVKKRKELEKKKEKKKKKKINGGWLPRISGVLKEFAFVGEDNNSNFSITQDRDLVGFLQQSISPFGKCHLPVDLVLYPLQLNPTPSHDFLFFFFSL